MGNRGMYDHVVEPSTEGKLSENGLSTVRYAINSRYSLLVILLCYPAPLPSDPI